MYSKADNGAEQVDERHPTRLYETHGRSIFGYLRAQGVSLQDAEDLLTEIFLAAMARDNLVTLSPHSQLLWLKRVAHNKLVNTYRYKSRHPQIPLEMLSETEFEENGPEQLFLRQEEHHQLRRHIQQLPELQQRVLQLRYGNELPYGEIALLLDKREGAIRQLLSRAILFLRRTYQQTEGEHRW